eukprot:scaffold285_cov330-Pavlova_lutheri.AAC.19
MLVVRLLGRSSDARLASGPRILAGFNLETRAGTRACVDRRSGILPRPCRVPASLRIDGCAVSISGSSSVRSAREVRLGCLLPLLPLSRDAPPPLAWASRILAARDA